MSSRNSEAGRMKRTVALHNHHIERNEMLFLPLRGRSAENLKMLAFKIAHNFNNFMSIIQGNVELAITKIARTEPAFDYLRQAYVASLRAANLAQQMLALGREKSVKFSAVNINKIVENLLKMLGCILDKEISTCIKLEPKVWNVRANARNVEQAVMNLVLNARDAMLEGGKITITTKNVTLEEEQAENLSDAYLGKYVCISVEDSGVGVKEEVISQMFEPFFSARENGKGTGLGLSIVKSIVAQHKGWIKVQSKRGRGSSFKVYFPVHS